MQTPTGANLDNNSTRGAHMRTKLTDAQLTGWAITAAREYRGLNISELAEHLGLHRNTLARMESGERPPKAIELAGIASVLEWPVEWLRGPTLPDDLGSYHFPLEL